MRLALQRKGRSKKLALAIHSLSGRKREERHEAGVGFAFKSELFGKLTRLPNGINDRLMTLRPLFMQPSSVPMHLR